MPRATLDVLHTLQVAVVADGAIVREEDPRIGPVDQIIGDIKIMIGIIPD